MRNIDDPTVESFGREWGALSQSSGDLGDGDRLSVFESYFSVFPWGDLPKNAVGADIGCGSGRWAALVAPRVGHLYAIDPSEPALAAARRNLSGTANVAVMQGSSDDLPIPDNSLDFAFCLGVLHHVPDTPAALRSIARKLKPGAPFLLYLYYALDNRPSWFRLIWQVTNRLRHSISRIPPTLQFATSFAIALLVYYPLARAARLLDRFSILPQSWPLSFYRDKQFYVMRTDAHDRFCTPLEKRFTRREIEEMLIASGYGNVQFSENEPFWVCVSYTRKRKTCN